MDNGRPLLSGKRAGAGALFVSFEGDGDGDDGDVRTVVITSGGARNDRSDDGVDSKDNSGLSQHTVTTTGGASLDHATAPVEHLVAQVTRLKTELLDKDASVAQLTATVLDKDASVAQLRATVARLESTVARLESEAQQKQWGDRNINNNNSI